MTHYLLVITQYTLLITHYSSLYTHYLLLITHYSLLIIQYLLNITHFSLLITHYTLLNKHYTLQLGSRLFRRQKQSGQTSLWLQEYIDHMKSWSQKTTSQVIRIMKQRCVWECEVVKGCSGLAIPHRPRPDSHIKTTFLQTLSLGLLKLVTKPRLSQVTHHQ